MPTQSHKRLTIGLLACSLLGMGWPGVDLTPARAPSPASITTPDPDPDPNRIENRIIRTKKQLRGTARHSTVTCLCACSMVIERQWSDGRALYRCPMCKRGVTF